MASKPGIFAPLPTDQKEVEKVVGEVQLPLSDDKRVEGYTDGCTGGCSAHTCGTSCGGTCGGASCYNPGP